MRVRFGVPLAALVAASLLALPAARSVETPPRQLVLSPEGNHLWAYDAGTGAAQLVVRAENGEDPGVAPNSPERRDVNGQVCVSPDGRHMISGEDTVISSGDDGGSSHDPRIAGWGYFQLDHKDGKLVATQKGKLAPAVEGTGPTYAGDPDNYGCGFLDDGRLLTTAIGNTFPHEEANGQLFLWFGPFTTQFHLEDPATGPSFLVGAVRHCEIAGGLATAGGIAVDPNGRDVYVAANRPDAAGNSGGVWKFSGEWPSSPAECTKAYLDAHIERTLLIPNRPAPTPVPDARAVTPSAVVVSPDDTLYVSSVFTGTVSEYTKAGVWVRDLHPTSPVAVVTGPTGDTPYGLAVTNDGSLWIADLGIVGGVPGPGLGSVVRVRFDERRNPIVPSETVASGLDFPDGLGVYTVTRR